MPDIIGTPKVEFCRQYLLTRAGSCDNLSSLMALREAVRAYEALRQIGLRGDFDERACR